MMRLKNTYYFFPKAIAAETCNKIIEIGRNQLLKKAKVGELSASQPTKRKSEVSFITEDWIYDLLNPYIVKANKEADWNFQWDWNEPSQFTIYRKNSFYGWHLDENPPYKDPDKNFNNKIRKISLTLQLTDKNKYKGGALQLRWIDDTKKNTLQTVTLKEARDLGSIIIFPSFVWHQVLPVTQGKRESLVNWSIGNRFI